MCDMQQWNYNTALTFASPFSEWFSSLAADSEDSLAFILVFLSSFLTLTALSFYRGSKWFVAHCFNWTHKQNLSTEQLAHIHLTVLWLKHCSNVRYVFLFTLAVFFDLGSAFAGSGLYKWKKEKKKERKRKQLRSAHVYIKKKKNRHIHHIWGIVQT